MFTSRAEFRLLLREDNADLRLTGRGIELGLVGAERARAFTEKRGQIERLRSRLQATRLFPGSTLSIEIEQRTGERITRETDLLTLLRRPALSIEALAAAVGGESEAMSASAAAQVEIQAKYDGYIVRQEEEIERLKRHESIRLPEEIDYQCIDGLSAELKQKLGAARPETLARAARIPGVTPAALSLLLVHARRVRESARA
jgi:tRNA uridine 5-carboxymethylaminomethyl modification enzyme